MNGYIKKITKDIIDPSIKGIDKNNKIVTIYIGCLTIPYIPVSTTFCPFSTSIVRNKYAFSLNTSAYKIYEITNTIDAIIVLTITTNS